MSDLIAVQAPPARQPAFNAAGAAQTDTSSTGFEDVLRVVRGDDDTDPRPTNVRDDAPNVRDDAQDPPEADAREDAPPVDHDDAAPGDAGAGSPDTAPGSEPVQGTADSPAQAGPDAPIAHESRQSGTASQATDASRPTPSDSLDAAGKASRDVVVPPNPPSDKREIGPAPAHELERGRVHTQQGDEVPRVIVDEAPEPGTKTTKGGPVITTSSSTPAPGGFAGATTGPVTSGADVDDEGAPVVAPRSADQRTGATTNQAQPGTEAARASAGAAQQATDSQQDADAGGAGQQHHGATSRDGAAPRAEPHVFHLEPVDAGAGVKLAGVKGGVPGTTSIAQGDLASPQAQQAFRASIMRGLNAAVRQRGGTLTINLIPPTLGKVQIRMSIDDGVVNVKMQVHNQAASRMLNSELPNLTHLLESKGMKVERVSVHLAPAPQGAPGVGGPGAEGADGSGARHDAAGQQSRGRSDEQHHPGPGADARGEEGAGEAPQHFRMALDATA